MERSEKFVMQYLEKIRIAATVTRRIYCVVKRAELWKPDWVKRFSSSPRVK